MMQRRPIHEPDHLKNMSAGRAACNIQNPSLFTEFGQFETQNIKNDINHLNMTLNRNLCFGFWAGLLAMPCIFPLMHAQSYGNAANAPARTYHGYKSTL